MDANTQTLTSAPKTEPKGATKFLYTLLMLVIGLAIVFGTVAINVKTASYRGSIIGIPLMTVYSIICFTVKKGSRGWVIWWGILGIAVVALWTILLIKE